MAEVLIGAACGALLIAGSQEEHSREIYTHGTVVAELEPLPSFEHPPEERKEIPKPFAKK